MAPKKAGETGSRCYKRLSVDTTGRGARKRVLSISVFPFPLKPLPLLEKAILTTADGGTGFGKQAEGYFHTDKGRELLDFVEIEEGWN